MKYFVFLLGKAFHCDLLVDASVKIPVTRDTMAKLVGLNKRSIVEYVVCPKCHCIYEYNDCVRTVDGKRYQIIAAILNSQIILKFLVEFLVVPCY